MEVPEESDAHNNLVAVQEKLDTHAFSRFCKIVTPLLKPSQGIGKDARPDNGPRMDSSRPKSEFERCETRWKTSGIARQFGYSEASSFSHAKHNGQCAPLLRQMPRDVVAVEVPEESDSKRSFIEVTKQGTLVA